MEKKPLWQSKTFWGVILTVCGIYLPRFATFLQGNLEQLITLVGLVMTLVGRWTATQPLSVTAPKE